MCPSLIFLIMYAHCIQLLAKPDGPDEEIPQVSAKGCHRGIRDDY